MLINESDMLGRAERGTTKLLISRVKIPYGSAEPYHVRFCAIFRKSEYITHPQGAYHEFRKEFYITAHSAYITRRKALYHERVAFYITSLCLTVSDKRHSRRALYTGTYPRV